MDRFIDALTRIKTELELGHYDEDGDRWDSEYARDAWQIAADTLQTSAADHTKLIEELEAAWAWVSVEYFSGGWSVELKNNETGETYCYIGDNLTAVLKRAWAGEPADESN